MGLVIEPVSEPLVPVDAAGLSAGFSGSGKADDLVRCSIVSGHHSLRAADFFRFRTQPAGEWDYLLQGDWSKVRNLASALKSGRLRIESSVAEGLGASMTGGLVDVIGNAGDGAGQGMLDGGIRIRGNAGHLLGSPFPGKAHGMNGGWIFVDGNCGDYAGFRLRRGTIVVKGLGGRLAGYELRGGNLWLNGGVGDDCGLNARRGTIVLGKKSSPPASGFRRAGIFAPEFLKILLNSFAGSDFTKDLFVPGQMELWSGDWVTGSKAELWLPPD